MSKFNSLTIIIFIAIPINFVSCKMTMDQMKQSGLMFRNICQPKLKVSDELLDKLRNGDFVEDKSLKCYTNCMLEIMQIVKKGKLLYESVKKQIETLIPIEIEKDFSNAFEICKDSGKMSFITKN